MKIRKWIVCQFGITITTKEAKSLGLKFHQNVYGDLINRFNCRSFWKDAKGNIYHIRELQKESK